VFTDGITNKLLGCFYEESPEDVVLVRVYGHKTDLLIDRNAETRNIQVLVFLLFIFWKAFSSCTTGGPSRRAHNPRS
jgi:hypothetical protein